MLGFLYFIPGAHGASAEALDAAGLAHLKGLSIESGQIDRGPAGGGLLIRIASKGRAPALRYDGDAQIWRKCGGGRFWLGYNRDHPPTPEDLARPDTIGGHLVTLEDGNKWLIPVARVAATGASPLFKLDLDDEGEWIAGDPIDRLAALTVDAQEIWQQLVDAVEGGENASGVMQLTVKTEADIGIRALAVNYYLGRFEVAALGLLSNRVTGSIAMALIDWPTIESEAAAQKKTEVEEKTSGDARDASGTSCGSEDSPEGMNRPTPTSTG